MKCYGNFTYLKNKKKTLNRFYKITGKRFLFRTNFSFFFVDLYVFFYWNFLILQKFSFYNNKIIFFFSPIYYFLISFTCSNLLLKFNSFCNTIRLTFKDIILPYRFFWKNFKMIFYSFSFFFFRRFRFRGKGYYIFKNIRNTITFRFGYSHRLYLYFFKFKVKFMSKTSIFIYGLNLTEIIRFGFFFKAVRPYNLFTGKGIRFTRQIIYKKIGKASTYI